MREPSEDRRRRIMAVVQARGAARVSDLASELEVSVVTVRRDVEELAQAGKLRRGHGVARSIGQARAVAVPRADPVSTQVWGGVVALVVPERHAYLNEIVHGARLALEEAGMRPALHLAPRAVGAERPLVERVLADGALGLLIAPRWRTVATEEADYAWLAGVTVPTVLMERRPRRGSTLHATDSACTDHWYGVHLAVDHLVSLGHRRIVFAARDDSPTARALRTAFAEIAAGRPEIEDWAVVLSAPDAGPDPVRHPGPDVEMAAVLREHRATAALMHGDTNALMLVQQLADAGVRVPEDCSVVAYDDVVAALGSTPLTAVAPPKEEVGRAAAELVLGRLGGSARPSRRVELLPTLQVRGSTQVK
jgi:DNA-binding LacI/PurR family transcriptional regulator